jgi:hypothetical protein
MITVSTSKYQFSHGKQPRGRGSWAFFFDGHTAIDDALWHNGTYGEAIKMARAYAVSKGYTLIEVGT